MVPGHSSDTDRSPSTTTPGPDPTLVTSTPFRTLRPIQNFHVPCPSPLGPNSDPTRGVLDGGPKTVSRGGTSCRGRNRDNLRRNDLGRPLSGCHLSLRRGDRRDQSKTETSGRRADHDFRRNSDPPPTRRSRPPPLDALKTVSPSGTSDSSPLLSFLLLRVGKPLRWG